MIEHRNHINLKKIKQKTSSKIACDIASYKKSLTDKSKNKKNYENTQNKNSKLFLRNLNEFENFLPLERSPEVQKQYDEYKHTPEAKTFIRDLFKDRLDNIRITENNFPYNLSKIGKKYHYVVWFNPKYYDWDMIRNDSAAIYLYKYFLLRVRSIYQTSVDYTISDPDSVSIEAVPHIHFFVNKEL
jgi:hypothetical protein